ncbi:MAG: type III pantothenate kinase [Phycisphaerales bacterium]
MSDAPTPRGSDEGPWADLAPPPGTALAVCVGNSRAKLGLVDGLSVRHLRSADARDAGAVASAAAEIATAADDRPGTLLIASVHRAASDAIAEACRGATGLRASVFGPGLPVPIAVDVTEPSRVGTDRLLAALGAFHRTRQACIIVDAGTAVTVDFVDGRGVFHGGAILPGAQLMLRALHEHTDALPLLTLADMPDPLEPFGRSTEHAMLLGVRAAVRGAVRFLAERYAEFYEAYPTIIATGGEAPTILGDDELIEAHVPELELLGVAVARARLASEPEG